MFGRKYGFTLIELLVVIAVVGVLAAAIVAVIDPGEQLAKARDAKRKNIVEQLGKAILAKTLTLDSYPPYSSSWMTALQLSEDLKSVPAEITPRPNNVACWSTSLLQNNFCYYTYNSYQGKGPQAWVWTNVESKELLNKCGVSVSTYEQGPYYVYDTIYNKTCLKCASDKGSNSWVFSGSCHSGE